MKAHAYALSLLFALSAAQAAEPPAAPAAPTPADQAAASMLKAAEALTEAQIKASTDRAALVRLAQIYDERDLQRFIWTLERLVALSPNSGELKLQLATVYARKNDKQHAYDVLMHMQTQGFGYDLSKDPRFEPIHGTKVWDYIVANLQANAKPFGETELAFELPKGDRLLESLAYDPKRKQFLVGSAREGVVYRAGKDGKLEEFIKADRAGGLYSVLDLAVDAERDTLWVSSAAVPVLKGYDEKVAGKAQLLKYKLSTGKLLGKVGMPANEQDHLVTALAVASDGRVYAADGVHNEIYSVEGELLKPVLANPKLSGIHGLTVSGDGKTLYFADYGLGIFGVELGTGKAFAVLHNPETLVLGGIESLSWYDGTLIAVESGMVPQRVMRLKLAEDGRSIVSAMPLSVAQPGFTYPTVGTQVGNEFYFIANSQRDLYDSYGVLKDETKLAPVRVFKANLRYAWDQPGISSVVPVAGKAGAPASAQVKTAPMFTPAKGLQQPADKKDDKK